MDLGRFVAEERRDPELQKCRKTIARGYAAAPAYRQTTSTVLDTGGLRRAVGTEAVLVATHVRALLASVVLPHFSFSLLPFLLPNIDLPEFIAELASWLRSVVFLDWGLLVRPECFVSADTPAEGTFTLRHLAWRILAAVAGAVDNRSVLRDATTPAVRR